MRRGASGALSESSQDKSGPVDGGDLAGFLHTRQCDRGMPKTPLSIVLKALCYSKVRQALGAADHGTDGGSNCTGTSFCTSEIPIIKPSTRKDRYSFHRVASKWATHSRADTRWGPALQLPTSKRERKIRTRRSPNPVLDWLRSTTSALGRGHVCGAHSAWPGTNSR